jgi:hypothetical protein
MTHDSVCMNIYTSKMPVHQLTAPQINHQITCRKYKLSPQSKMMVTRSMRRRGEVDTWPPFVINSQISSSGGEVSHSAFCAGYRQLLGRKAFCFLYRIRTVQGRTAFVSVGGLHVTPRWVSALLPCQESL